MKQRYWYGALAVIAATAGGCISLPFVERFAPGVYQGEAEGCFGMIYVSVETDASSIIEVNLLDHREDAFIGGEAMEELQRLVLEEDSTDIDAITGATLSSKGFLDAVEQALRKAALAPSHTFQKGNANKIKRAAQNDQNSAAETDPGTG